jgi:hypothetical protein
MPIANHFYVHYQKENWFFALDLVLDDFLQVYRGGVEVLVLGVFLEVRVAVDEHVEEEKRVGRDANLTNQGQIISSENWGRCEGGGNFACEDFV